MILSIYALMGESNVEPKVTPQDIDEHVQLALTVSLDNSFFVFLF